MSNVNPDQLIITVADPYHLGTSIDEIQCRKITVSIIAGVTEFNGQAVVGTLVFTASTQTLTNKSFTDTSNFFTDATDPTIKVGFDAAGGAGTTGTIKTVQTADRVYTVPEVGADANFVMTEGAQTINGAKTFSTNISTAQLNAIGATNQIVFDPVAGNKVTLTVPVPAANTTVTLPDPGVAAASIVLTESAQTINGALTLTSALNVTPTTNQVVLGVTNTTTLNAVAPAASRVYTIPDSGADATFVMTEGAQTVNGAKTFSNLTVTAFSTDTVSEKTANAGVTIDGLRIREDTLAAPAITIVSMTPTGAATDIPIVVVPKGAGALQLQVPDNTATGGNARGQYAVDIQRSRTLATQVASGDYSFVGGANSTASGAYSFAYGNNATAGAAGVVVFKDSDSTQNLSVSTTNTFAGSFTNGYQLTGGITATGTSTDYLYPIPATATTAVAGSSTVGLAQIPTTAGKVYLVTAKICAIGSGNESAVFKISARVKNIAGTLTVGTAFDHYVSAETGLNQCDVTIGSFGSNIVVSVALTASPAATWTGVVELVY